MLNWDDPSERAALIDRVGPAEYERLHREHMERSVVKTVGGYSLRPVSSRFGRIYVIDGSGPNGSARLGFATVAQCEAWIKANPK